MKLFKITYSDLFLVICSITLGMGLGKVQDVYSMYKNNHLFFQCMDNKSNNNYVDFSYSNIIIEDGNKDINERLIYNFPIKFYVNKANVNQKDFEAIVYAGKIWDEAFGKKIFIFEYTNEKIVLEKDNKNSIVFLNTWEENKSSEQARTSSIYYNSEIQESDIRVNLKNFSYYTLKDKNNYSKYSLESLLIHELGHSIGLKHYPNSVMNKTLDAQNERVFLTKNDLSTLGCKYPKYKSNINNYFTKNYDSKNMKLIDNSSLSNNKQNGDNYGK